MIVVADTSPLNYLIQIECDLILPKLYGRIVVPSGVMRELRDPGAPSSVSRWLLSPPVWVDVVTLAIPPDPQLDSLGIGEREAIQISGALNADLLLIDERKGRLEAQRRGFRTTGTLGVLIAAGQMKLVDAESAYARLVAETSFRTSPGLESELGTRLNATR
jgi:predicted nucleic acid-binding protein